MKYLVIGAGQIGGQLVRELSARGDEVMVLRRSAQASRDGVRVVRGDAADPRLVAQAADGASAIFHCIHTAYDHRAWRRELPRREQVAMDVAARCGIPVVFPESVYAYGSAAEDLAEGADPRPCSPLGQVRSELLRDRARHPAEAISVVAADLIGPGTSSSASVATGMVLEPLVRGRRPLALADPSQPHSWTYLPDLVQSMVFLADHASAVLSRGQHVWNAPTPEPRSVQELVAEAQQLLAGPSRRLRRVPSVLFKAAAPFSATARELAAQQYLWRNPAVLQPGRLMQEGLQAPTDWATVMKDSLAALTSPTAR